MLPLEQLIFVKMKASPQENKNTQKLLWSMFQKSFPEFCHYSIGFNWYADIILPSYQLCGVNYRTIAIFLLPIPTGILHV
jgi:hypothetical protein